MAPINNVCHSLFSDCTIRLNDIAVINGENYAFRAYFDQIFNYNTLSMGTCLAAAGFVTDEADKFQLTNLDDNPGFDERREFFLKRGIGISEDDTRVFHGNVVTFVGKLSTDFRSTPMPIIPGTRVNIQLTKSPNDFVIQNITDDETYRIEV